MSNILLKFRFLVFFIFFVIASTHAQDSRFIYIQNETKQPFFVKMDKKVLNSSAEGFLIIPKITNSNNKLTIGFPKNEWPELNVTVNLSEAENGFVLRNVKGKGWTLIEIQTVKSEVKDKPVPVAVKKELKISVNANEFARILAEVVNDPSIAELAVVKEEAELPIKATVAVIKPDLPLKVPERITKVVEPIKETVKIDQQEEPVIVHQVVVKTQHASVNDKEFEAEKTKTQVDKLAENTTNAGLMLSYIDKIETDTINILLPITEPVEPVKEVKKVAVVESVFVTTEKPAVKPDPQKKDIRFLDMELRNPNLKQDSGSIVKDDFVIKEKRKTVNNTIVAEPEKSPSLSKAKSEMINSDCKKIASQNDFLQLRKKMASKSEENEMLKLANKDFLKICFTSEQIRSLSALFSTEEERYRFFVAAFPHVSDSDNYDALEGQLSDNYYKTRFKAMVSQ